jgi:hypothetical protein
MLIVTLMAELRCALFRERWLSYVSQPHAWTVEESLVCQGEWSV